LEFGKLPLLFPQKGLRFYRTEALLDDVVPIPIESVDESGDGRDFLFVRLGRPVAAEAGQVLRVRLAKRKKRFR
jgi:hypothetical protein